MKTLLALILSAIMSLTAAIAAPKGSEAPNTIVDLVVSNPDVTGDEDGDFDILLAAVQNADPSIGEALSEKVLTVFAPTDDAFTALLEKLEMSAEDLLSNTDLLNQVLLYHVVGGRQDAAAVTSTDHLRMLDGNKTMIKGKESGAYINDAKIIATDVDGGNGIVHVIDTVMLPPGK